MTGIDLIKARAFLGGGSGSGGGVKVTPLTVTENGTYTAESGTAYSPVTVNVAAQGGGDLDALIEGSIMEVVSAATEVKEEVFKYCQQLTTAYFSAAASVGKHAFDGCHKLSTAEFEVAGIAYEGAFQNCEGIATVYFSSKVSIGRYVFYNCPKLTALILRSAELCTISHTDSLGNTPIASGTGYIYVPAALVDSYKAATNWSTHAAQFRALEDYTVDGTITGELDPEKIGA